MSLRIVGRKVMSCRLISFFDCEMFHSRPVSRVLPRDVNSAGVLKVSNVNIEAWFKNLLSFDIMPLRCQRPVRWVQGKTQVYFRFKDCAVTNRLSFFLSRFLPDSYRCKVREKFSAYTTCLIRIEHLSGDRKCQTKISDFFYSSIILVSDVRESSP